MRTEQKEIINPQDQTVVVIMGSASDMEHCQKMFDVFDRLGVNYDKGIYSAHKTQTALMIALDNYKIRNQKEELIFITAAGLSNALSGFIKGYLKMENPPIRVIACPPYNEQYGGVNIWSSLQMPYGTDVPVILDPGNTALFAVESLARNNPELASKYMKEQKRLEDKVLSSNT